MAKITVAQAIEQLQGLPQDAELVVYDPDEGVVLGGPDIREMYKDESGDLWLDPEDAEDQADLADCVSGPDEKAVAGNLTKVVAIRTSAPMG